MMDEDNAVHSAVCLCVHEREAEKETAKNKERDSKIIGNYHMQVNTCILVENVLPLLGSRQ